MSEAKSKVPVGAFVPVSMNEIDEGKFLKKLNRQLIKGHSDLVEYMAETGDQSGTVVIHAVIKLKKTKGVKDHFSIIAKSKMDVPVPASESVIKARNGQLLCQPVGASELDPDQQVFFDGDGKPLNTPASPVKDVAGKIEKAV